VEDEMNGTIAVLAQMGGRYDDHMGWDDGSSWVMVGVMIIVAVAVVGAVVWAIVFASRSTGPSGTPAPTTSPSQQPTARLLLDERYARGDIDTEEYRERRSALTDT
jgi:putative membrane protein